MAVVVTAAAAPGADLAVAAASEVVPTEDITVGIMGRIFTVLISVALIFGDTGAVAAAALGRC